MARGDGYRKFSMKIGMALGAGGKAAGEAINYLLRFIGAGADDKVFTDGEAMDTPEEGMFDGELTVTKNAAASVSLLNGELSLSGASAGWGNNCGVRGQGISRQFGQGFYYKIIPNLDQMMVGVHQSTTFTSSGEALIHFLNNNTIRSRDGVSAPLVGYYTQNILHEIMVITRSVGASFFIRGGASPYEYTTWTLLSIAGAGSSVTLYPSLQVNNSAFENQECLIIKVPDTLYLEQITPTTTLTTETSEDTHSNVLIDGSHTAVTGQIFRIDYRRSGDGLDSWRVKIAQGVANNITLHKVVSGVESAALSTGSATINNGVSYNVQIRAQGDDWHKVCVDGVEKNTYTTTDTHQLSATGTKLTVGTISTYSMDVYAGDGYSFEGV